MSAALKRRLQRLEMIAGRNNSSRYTVTLIEPAADACEEQWRQFAIRKAEAEASAETIVVIRASRPAHPIDYRGRIVIVPPKIPAVIGIKPLSMEGNAHAH